MSGDSFEAMLALLERFDVERSRIGKVWLAGRFSTTWEVDKTVWFDIDNNSDEAGQRAAVLIHGDGSVSLLMLKHFEPHERLTVPVDTSPGDHVYMVEVKP